MSRTFNMVGGGGGKAVLAVTITNGTATSVTATKSGVSVSLTYSGGIWFAVLPSFGAWTVSATDGTRSQTDTVNASVAGIYTLTLRLQDVPNAYTQLEYLESTGTQWINTEYQPTITTNAEFAFKDTGTQNNQYQFGAYSSGTPEWFNVNLTGGGKIMQFRFFETAINNPYDTNKHRLEAYSKAGEQKCYLDGALIISNNLSSFAASFNNLYLFSSYSTNQSTQLAERASKVRIYSVKLSNGTTSARNMIPARRNSDSVLGMYDTVNNVFYTNAGTGSFVAGPAV